MRLVELFQAGTGQPRAATLHSSARLSSCMSRSVSWWYQTPVYNLVAWPSSSTHFDSLRGKRRRAASGLLGHQPVVRLQAFIGLRGAAQQLRKWHQEGSHVPSCRLLGTLAECSRCPAARAGSPELRLGSGPACETSFHKASF